TGVTGSRTSSTTRAERAQPLAPEPRNHLRNAHWGVLIAGPRRSMRVVHEVCLPPATFAPLSPPERPGLERRRRWSHERARERSRRATEHRLSRGLWRGFERW